MKRKTIKILTISGMIFLMILVLVILGLIIFKKRPSTPNKNWQYKLIYQVETTKDKFEIYKTKENKVIVYSETQSMCIKTPCERIKMQDELVFSENNKKTVTDFIDSIFKNTNITEKEISKDDLNQDQLNILYGIIYNDESYLNTKIYTLKSNKYTITTDMKWKTMLNDGGSYKSIIYEMDLKDMHVVKKEEIYKANPTGTPERTFNTIYDKKIDVNLYNETIKIISESISKEDINIDNNYDYYSITSDNENKDIYNVNTIKIINDLLDKFDNFSLSN